MNKELTGYENVKLRARIKNVKDIDSYISKVRENSKLNEFFIYKQKHILRP